MQAALPLALNPQEKWIQFTSKNGDSDDCGVAPCQVNSGK